MTGQPTPTDRQAAAEAVAALLPRQLRQRDCPVCGMSILDEGRWIRHLMLHRSQGITLAMAGEAWGSITRVHRDGAAMTLHIPGRFRARVSVRDADGARTLQLKDGETLTIAAHGKRPTEIAVSAGHLRRTFTIKRYPLDEQRSLEKAVERWFQEPARRLFSWDVEDIDSWARHVLPEGRVPPCEALFRESIVAYHAGIWLEHRGDPRCERYFATALGGFSPHDPEPCDIARAYLLFRQNRFREALDQGLASPLHEAARWLAAPDPDDWAPSAAGTPVAGAACETCRTPAVAMHDIAMAEAVTLFEAGAQTTARARLEAAWQLWRRSLAGGRGSTGYSRLLLVTARMAWRLGQPDDARARISGSWKPTIPSSAKKRCAEPGGALPVGRQAPRWFSPGCRDARLYSTSRALFG